MAKGVTGTFSSDGIQPGRCPIVQQGGPSRHHATARKSEGVCGGNP